MRILLNVRFFDSILIFLQIYLSFYFSRDVGMSLYMNLY